MAAQEKSSAARRLVHVRGHVFLRDQRDRKDHPHRLFLGPCRSSDGQLVPEFVAVLYLINSLWIISGFFWLTTLQLTTKLENMADTDPLTRLANRRVFCEWMQRELMRSLRTSVPFSLLVIDLDHFKRVNDTLGHNAGDEIIRIAVERMQDSVRGIDVLGRWGGEEFVALLPRATIEAAELVAERIRRNMEMPFKLRVRGEDETLHVTVSLGVTSYRGSDDTVNDMFERADRALYNAKTAGRNCILTAA